MVESDPSHPVGNYPRLPDIETLPEWQYFLQPDMVGTPAADEGELVEAARTRLLVRCLEDVAAGDMSRFPLLTHEQRSHLYAEVQHVVKDHDDADITAAEVLDTLRFYGIAHDLFKSRRACKDAGLAEGTDHDDAFRFVMATPEARDRVLPSFSLLSEKSRELAVRMSKIQSDFAQSLQGEAPGEVLADLHHEPDPLVRDTEILFKMFDIFGALGNVNEQVSLTATTSVYRRISNLASSLKVPGIATPEERNTFFLIAEFQDFFGRVEPATDEQAAMFLALARLSCHLRIENKQEMLELAEAVAVQPGVIKAILITELNRKERPTLAGYSPALVQTITKMYGTEAAIAFYAHVLQEAHIADAEARREGLPGIARVQLDGLVRDIRRGAFNPTKEAMRFDRSGEIPSAVRKEARLSNLEGVPAFNGEPLRGKRIVLVAEGGGSEAVQAAMTGELLARNFGCQVAAVLSVRRKECEITSSGQCIGRYTKQVTPDSRQLDSSWRFLERVPIEDNESTPMYLLNATNSPDVTADVHAFLDTIDTDVVIGVDTGGDSLYGEHEHAPFSAPTPADTAPSNQDFNVIKSLAAVADERSDVDVLSVIVAPGIDSPEEAKALQVLAKAKAARWVLGRQDAQLVQETYRRWRMDGSGSNEGRYGKTPLAWLKALDGKTGLRVLDLPFDAVTSTTNPWRAFITVTPPMADLVIMDMRNHFAAVE